MIRTIALAFALFGLSCGDAPVVVQVEATPTPIPCTDTAIPVWDTVACRPDQIGTIEITQGGGKSAGRVVLLCTCNRSNRPPTREPL